MGIEQRFMGPEIKMPRASVMLDDAALQALEASRFADVAVPEVGLKPGDMVVALDGKGGSFSCEVESIDDKRMRIKFVSEQTN